jgi:hypothetical protein
MQAEYKKGILNFVLVPPAALALLQECQIVDTKFSV